jgi:hypothetical protein
MLHHSSAPVDRRATCTRHISRVDQLLHVAAQLRLIFGLAAHSSRNSSRAVATRHEDFVAVDRSDILARRLGVAGTKAAT